MESYPKVFFHGTNGRYERAQREKFGTYRHNGAQDDVQLTTSDEWAVAKAVESMHAFQAFENGGAILLMIDSGKLMAPARPFQYPEGCVPAERKWLISELHPDTYEIISVIQGYNDEVKRAIRSAFKRLK